MTQYTCHKLSWFLHCYWMLWNVKEREVFMLSGLKKRPTADETNCHREWKCLKIWPSPWSKDYCTQSWSTQASDNEIQQAACPQVSVYNIFIPRCTCVSVIVIFTSTFRNNLVKWTSFNRKVNKIAQEGSKCPWPFCNEVITRAIIYEGLGLLKLWFSFRLSFI